MPYHEQLERTFHISSESLHLVRVMLHGRMPVVLLLLAIVIVVDPMGVGEPATKRVLLTVEYVVLVHFVSELSLDLSLYRDTAAFFRERWIDLVLILPVLLVVRFGAWLGGVVLFGRALLAIEYVSSIGLEAYAIEELILAGSRFQRWLAFTRKIRQIFRRDRFNL